MLNDSFLIYDAEFKLFEKLITPLLKKNINILIMRKYLRKVIENFLRKHWIQFSSIKSKLCNLFNGKSYFYIFIKIGYEMFDLYSIVIKSTSRLQECITFPYAQPIKNNTEDTVIWNIVLKNYKWSLTAAVKWTKCGKLNG